MMISVAIVSVLAAVALPNFQRYQLKVKSAEARTLMGGIVTSQEAFVAEFENYANINVSNPAGIPVRGKTDWASVACPATCDRESTQTCTSFECIGFQPPAAVFYQYIAPHQLAMVSSPAEWAGAARSDLDGDGVFGSFAYRSGNDGDGQGDLHDTISSCPANIQVTLLYTCTPADF